MKIAVAVLLMACFELQAEDVPKEMIGSWKCDLAKTDWSHKSGGAPREITLMITATGWRYDSEGGAGTNTHLVYDRTSRTLTGNDQISMRDEPTGNPFVSDIRVSLKANGQEVERVIIIGVPGGKSLLVYGSGVSADGKPWWDRSYFTRADSSQTRNAPE
jgi:hypothetical protein